MNARHIRRLVVLFVMSMLCLTNASAQEQSTAQEQTAAAPQAANQLAITRAETDTGLSQLTITGLNFGDDAPQVKLEGVPLTLITSTPTQIVAFLTPGLQPGTYLLTVSRGRRERENAVFHVTIGATGPQGP
ncbi:MAG: IPT/TIG domain-containing protein, partial [Pyrinomonadaceae bacterium]